MQCSMWLAGAEVLHTADLPDIVEDFNKER
jgi:hypothetical protein